MERTALKEWSVVVDALARGAVIALVRKGGIREQRAGFVVRPIVSCCIQRISMRTARDSRPGSCLNSIRSPPRPRPEWCM